MECVASCSTQNALQFALPPRAVPTTEIPNTQRWSGRTLSPIAAAMVIAALFFGGVGFARITHHWQTNISDDVYRQMIPHVDEETHPGF